MMCWNYDKTPWEEFPDMSISLLSSISNSKEFRLKIPPQVRRLTSEANASLHFLRKSTCLVLVLLWSCSKVCLWIQWFSSLFHKIFRILICHEWFTSRKCSDFQNLQEVFPEKFHEIPTFGQMESTPGICGTPKARLG